MAPTGQRLNYISTHFAWQLNACKSAANPSLAKAHSHLSSTPLASYINLKSTPKRNYLLTTHNVSGRAARRIAGLRHLTYYSYKTNKGISISGLAISAKPEQKMAKNVRTNRESMTWYAIYEA